MLIPEERTAMTTSTPLPIDNRQRDLLLDQYSMGMSLEDCVALVGGSRDTYEALANNEEFVQVCKRRRAITIGTLLQQAFDGAQTAAAKGNPAHTLALLKLISPEMAGKPSAKSPLSGLGVAQENLLGGSSINFNFVMPDKPKKQRKAKSDDWVVDDAVVTDEPKPLNDAFANLQTGLPVDGYHIGYDDF